MVQIFIVTLNFSIVFGQILEESLEGEGQTVLGGAPCGRKPAVDSKDNIPTINNELM